MKAKTLLVALFVAGFAASFAIAAPGSDDRGKEKHKGKSTSTATTTTGTTTTTPSAGCKNVHLTGTATPATFTMAVEKASKRAGNVKTATFTFSGKVRVSARMCSTGAAGAASTFELRSLKVGAGDEDDD